jgi:hypothetical protein
MAKEHAEEPLGGICVSVLLKQNIKRGTILIDSTPEPVLLTCDAHGHLI